MSFSRAAQVRVIGGVFQGMAALCIVAGVVVGWVAPRLGPTLAGPLGRPIAASGVDATTFLGAALTTLGVIVAILIGYNVAGLQTAGQLMSLALARAMLLSLAPFLLWWTVTTGVGLIYLLEPPVYLGQLWQMLVWFAAVVLFMLGYLWMLPWRLSGEYAARWAADDLRGAPIDQWEAQDGYAVLQSSIAAATTRGDLGAVRALAQTLGGFLVTARDSEAERANGYDRGRYRALKNLLSGCAQFAGAAPTTVAYQLGHVAAGTLLRAAAIGLPTGDLESDLFSGLLRHRRQRRPDRFHVVRRATRALPWRWSHGSLSLDLLALLSHMGCGRATRHPAHRQWPDAPACGRMADAGARGWVSAGAGRGGAHARRPLSQYWWPSARAHRKRVRRGGARAIVAAGRRAA